MFGQCGAGLWNGDDFTTCFERDYFQTLFPLLGCGVSLLYLSYQVFRSARRGNLSQQHEPLKADLANGNGRLGGSYSDDEETDSEEEDELARRQELALQPTKSRTNASVMTVDKPKGEVAIALAEEVAVVAELGLQIASFVLQVWGRKGTAASIATVATWAYITVLTSLRLLFSSTSRLSFPRLWYHTSFLYGWQWLITTFVFRSQLIHPRSNLAQVLTIADFAIVSLLFFIALTSRKGNKAVGLEYEGDVQPSKEPLASVFSLATFSWVDAIVWQGYRKTFEMSDVWNLVPKDKAANILLTYRQLKKTNALAWHLLKYFKRQIIIQAAWAAISGVITFVPTLLLKAILEYVEDPISTPRNAAWFYVILLFVSGLINALSSGQALWIGRKVCLRLRAIIIGEIYAKALRRRAGATSDKILGGETTNQNDDEPKRGFLEKLWPFGRKKKSGAAATTDGQLQAPVDDSQVSSGRSSI